MANDKYITHFTASDIERYHKGQLSAKQMHDLEKAALDDPFLADALEGYAVPGVNVAADMTDLKNRLTKRTEGAKVIPLQSAPKRSFRSMRAAVMILFIAGASLLVYKLGFDKKNNAIVQADQPAKENNTLTDTTKNALDPGGNISEPVVVDTNPGTTGNNSEIKQNPPTSDVPGGKTTQPVVENGKGEVNTTGTTVIPVNADPVTVKTTTVPNINAPAKSNDDAVTLKKDADKNAERKIAANDKFLDRSAAEEAADAKEKAASQQNRNVAAKRAENNLYNNTNTFRGRVIDAENRGVPFANVTNVQDKNAGTFTDASGYFNLTYPDSVLNVQVRSIGFENNNVQLRNSVPTNEVVMQDDRKALSEVTTVSRQRVDANAPTRSRDNNMKLETPEPADGWGNYNTYVLNNLEVPEDLQNQPVKTGEVQVSFEVDKNGEPTNFKIEKSLCTKCDKEAIRLIKAGPKWIRNANKKARTTVTIAF